jgi:nitroreductase
MELLQAIKTRSSTRRYAEAAVPVENLAEMLELAATAPSACNRRGWKCVLVQRREDLEWLFLHGGSSVFQNSSQALLVCYERQTENSAWDDNIQSAAAFIAYFQLIAHDRGIGSCWICHLPPKREVCEHFGIPSMYTPVAVVTFGSYQEGFSRQARDDDKQDILSQDRWAFDSGGNTRLKGLQLRKLLRMIYYALPFRFFLRRWVDRYEKKYDE